MRPSDYYRIKPGKAIDGVFYHHCESFDPLDETWHSDRACAEKSDALAISDRHIRIIEQAVRDAGRKR